MESKLGIYWCSELSVQRSEHVGSDTGKPPTNHATTRLQSSRGRRKSRPAALIKRTWSQAICKLNSMNFVETLWCRYESSYGTSWKCKFAGPFKQRRSLDFPLAVFQHWLDFSQNSKLSSKLSVLHYQWELSTICHLMTCFLISCLRGFYPYMTCSLMSCTLTTCPLKIPTFIPRPVSSPLAPTAFYWPRLFHHL